MNQFAPGSRFRNYTIVGEIARGGQGVVLSARHASGSAVALKLLLDTEPRTLKRFLQEARVMSRLDHPHLLRVFEHGEEQGAQFMAVEYVAGQDLMALVKGRGVPAFGWTAQVLTLVAHTLEYCHTRGVIHRDVKPANILVENGTGRPVLVDFGLVKRDAAEMHMASLDVSVMSKSGSVKGTPEFMAPEQVNPTRFGEVTERADVYGLGATLYCMLTGQPPFTGSAAVVVMRKVTKKPPVDPRELNPEVPDALAELCLRCLEKAAADRPASAAAFAAALQQAAGIQVPAPQPRRPPTGRITRVDSDSGSHPSLSSSSSGGLLPNRLPQPGETFAGCVIERELARGGAGAVFVAQQPSGSRLAIKVLLGDLTQDEKRERFVREAQVGRELQHPNIAQVLGRGEDRGMAYLAMELIEGGLPLDEYVQQNGVGLAGRVQLMLQVAQALEAAHDMELIHRDLKPDNVLVKPDGQVKVLDFGLARHLDKERLTMSGAVMGTVRYMAPEQVMGKAHQSKPSTDVWAMGVMLYELIKGELPFAGSTNLEIMAGIVDDEPSDPCADLDDPPRGLSEVIRLALAKDPEERYANAAAFGRDLVAAHSGSGSVSAVNVLAARSRKRLATRLASALAVLLILAGFGAWLATRTSQLDEDALRERADALEERLEGLTQGGPLGDLDPDLGGVGGALADLRERTPPESHELIARLEGRVQALQGLRALASGDVDQAASVAKELGELEAPEADALRGAVAAVTSGDAGEAQRLLARALRRGVDAPELYRWRAQGRVRVGLAGEQDAQDVLDDLGRAGSLGDLERGWRVQALARLSRLEEADAELEQIADPPPRLRWTLGLERVAPLLAKKPEEAAEIVKGLGARPPGSLPQAEAVSKEARLLAGRLLARPPELSEEDKVDLTALLRCAAVGAQPLKTATIDRLLDHITGHRVTKYGSVHSELALAFGELCADDLRVQKELAKLSDRVYSPKNKQLYLPFLERVIALEPSREERAFMQVHMCRSLAWICQDYPEHLGRLEEVATQCLPSIDDPEQRAWVLGTRGRGFHLSKKYEEALADIQEAQGLADHTTLRLWRAETLKALGRDAQGAFEDAKVFVLAQTVASIQGEIAMAISWELGIQLGEHDAVRRVIAHLLSLRSRLPGWWVRLAWLQLKTGKPAGVKESLTRAESFFDIPKVAVAMGDAPTYLEEVRVLLGMLEKGEGDLLGRTGQLVNRLEDARKKNPNGRYP